MESKFLSLVLIVSYPFSLLGGPDFSKVVRIEKPEIVCPKTIGEWDDWRKKVVSNWESDIQKASETTMIGSRRILEQLNKCRVETPKLFKDGTLNRCFAKIESLAREGATLESFMGKTFDGYVQQTGKFTKPPDVLNNKSFLKALSTAGKEDKAVKYLVEINKQRRKRKQPVLQFLAYDSALNPSRSGVQRRFIVLDELGGIDRWLIFEMPNSKSPQTPPQLVGALTVADGKSYYSDFEYNRSFTGLERKMEKGLQDSCVRCHKSGGPIKIVPKNPVKNVATLKRLNAVIAKYGMATPKGYVSSENLGPSLGATENNYPELAKRRSDAFFDKCTADIKPSDTYKKVLYPKLREAMQCSSCHDGAQRGLIQLPFNASVIQAMLESGRMPPSHGLNPEQGSALFKCLKEEFAAPFSDPDGAVFPSVLANYLMQEDCKPKPRSPPPASPREPRPSSAPAHAQ